MDALERAGCSKIFVETMTGTRADRPELESLLTYARAGDTLSVYRLDRLSRSLRDLLNIMDRLEKLEIGLTSLSEPIDTNSPSRWLAVHMRRRLVSMRWRALRRDAPLVARRTSPLGAWVDGLAPWMITRSGWRVPSWPTANFPWRRLRDRSGVRRARCIERYRVADARSRQINGNHVRKSRARPERKKEIER